MNLTTIINQAVRQPALPLLVQCEHNQTLECTQLLRLVPNKRAVFKARFKDKDVIAKVFLGSAQRQLMRELRGYAYLGLTTLKTPTRHALLIEQGQPQHHIVIYEYVEAATLDDLWQHAAAQKNSSQELQTSPQTNTLNQDQQKIIVQALSTIAHMHEQGIWQSDLHLDNFLAQNSEIIIIDVGSVCAIQALNELLNSDQDLLKEALSNSNQKLDEHIKIETQQKLDEDVSLENLALFIAQFKRTEQNDVLALCAQYFSARNDSELSLKSTRETDLLARIEQRWSKRRAQYNKKSLNSNTQIFKDQSWQHLILCSRQDLQADLKAFCENPEAVMQSATPLKLGNSSTVVVSQLDGKPVVIKRYQYKSLDRRLRRFLRTSRAMRSWTFARYLDFCGIKTPRPIALMEKRFGPFRGVSYFICELIEGQDLDTLMQQQTVFNAAELQQLHMIFSTLQKEQVVHGDFKATNLIKTAEHIQLIDLDSIERIEQQGQWQKAKNKDFRRFKANWSQRNDVIKQLDDSLKNIFKLKD